MSFSHKNHVFLSRDRCLSLTELLCFSHGNLVFPSRKPGVFSRKYCVFLTTPLLLTPETSLCFHFWICLPHLTQSTTIFCSSVSIYLLACHPLCWNGSHPT